MCRLLVASLAWLAVVAAAGAAAPPPGVPVMGNVPRVTPTDFKLVSTSNASSLYEIVAPALNTTAPGHAAAYDEAPLLLRLKGSRFQAGYDYSALMHVQADETLRTFANSLFNATEQALFFRFIDFLWEKLMLPNTPAEHLEELRGMRAWHAEHPGGVQYTADVVTTRFLTLASLPADGQNIIAALEQDLEPKDWPQWLRDLVNLIIALLEKIIHGCDAYAVWGSRTQGGLFSSRNLDFNSDTGINRCVGEGWGVSAVRSNSPSPFLSFKTVVVFDLDDATGGPYAQIGFGSGLGVLAGFNAKGVTTSEMNLDNHHVSLAAPAFPTRLRMVLERSVDLDSAMTVWNSTSNVNSFNFLLASSASNAAYALETKMGYTAVFPANSPIERDSTVVCTGETCSKWTNATGIVKIGKPLPEAVWRSNHGLNPTIIETQVGVGGTDHPPALMHAHHHPSSSSPSSPVFLFPGATVQQHRVPVRPDARHFCRLRGGQPAHRRRGGDCHCRDAWNQGRELSHL